MRGQRQRQTTNLKAARRGARGLSRKTRCELALHSEKGPHCSHENMSYHGANENYLELITTKGAFSHMNGRHQKCLCVVSTFRLFSMIFVTEIFRCLQFYEIFTVATKFVCSNENWLCSNEPHDWVTERARAG